ncbi:MAG: sensor histidine kinase [Beijerinckiaceae bacterium]
MPATNKDNGFFKGFGLSSRLLVLTILFVMLAEVLIFVPSIANFRNSWLNDRLAAARTAALVLEAAPDDALPEQLVKDLLMSVGAETIALRIKGTRRLLAINEMPPMVSAMTDMRQTNAFRSIVDSFQTMLRSGKDALGVIGNAAMEGEFVEIVVLEKPLRDAMWRFAGNILGLSLFISGVTAALVFFALKRVIVRPVERLTSNISRFAQRPDDLTRMMKPSGRTDEIGVAETAVAGMQQALSQQLKQKEHLAALGLAVSKINHDLRNMLSSAQLISDRLGDVQDPTVQRFAPKLVQTLDRAIAFCQSSLAYGRAEERPPQIETVALSALVEETREVSGMFDNHPVFWNNRVPAGFAVEADPEHLFRIITNLTRNALQAMENHPPEAGSSHSFTVTARTTDAGWLIALQDSGPGIPEALKQKLFDAFHGSTRVGGTGLGLAIAAELARAQGGELTLLPSAKGACFQLFLPKR